MYVYDANDIINVRYVNMCIDICDVTRGGEHLVRREGERNGGGEKEKSSSGGRGRGSGRGSGENEREHKQVSRLALFLSPPSISSINVTLPLAVPKPHRQFKESRPK